jgi:muramidase (phage lysozyme)
MDRKRGIALAALAAGGAYLFLSRSANAGVRYQGGYVDAGILPDYTGNASLALQNLLASWTTTTEHAIPGYTAVIGPADYDDALPGSDLWGDWVATPEWTPWDSDDAEQLPADYWNVNWGQYSDDSIFDEFGDAGGGGGRIIPIGNFMNGEKNLQAFLKAIRWAEGTSDEYGYQALYGYRPGNGKIFDSFADHPRISFKTPWGTTSAAGAYQMQAGTWDDAQRALMLTDFSPASQDAAAIWIIDKRRKALNDILTGRFWSAVQKLRNEWASLPASQSGQPKRSWADMQRMLLSYGYEPSNDDPNATVYV